MDTHWLWACTVRGVYTWIRLLISSIEVHSVQTLLLAHDHVSSWVLMRKPWKPSFQLRDCIQRPNLQYFIFPTRCTCIWISFSKFHFNWKIKYSHHEEHWNFLDATVVGSKGRHSSLLPWYNWNSSASFSQMTKYSANLSLEPDIDQLMLQLAFSTFLPARQ